MQTIVALVTDLMFHVKIDAGARQAGRSVRYAGTVDAALAAARESKPVLVVADLNASRGPGVDVLELARLMKADPELRDTPLLGFISHVQEDRKREALAAGFDRVVARSTFSDKAAELMAG